MVPGGIFQRIKIYKQIKKKNRQISALFQQGQYEQAEPVAQQVVDLTRELRGDAHPDYATSLNNLAVVYQSMGNYDAAEPLLQQQLGIMSETGGSARSDYAICLNNLAELYRLTGKYASAEPLYRQANDIWRNTLGESHPDYAHGLSNLALLYASMGKYAAAEPLYYQSLEIRRTTLGEAHPDYAISLNNLAELYSSMGNYTAAEPLYRQALEIRKKALGEAHPDYAISLNNLAGLYRSIGNYPAAEPLYRQASDIWRKALGADHPDYASSLNNLAFLYDSMGNYAAAGPLYRQALVIRRNALGDDHPAYAESLNNLARMYKSLGNFAEAEMFYRQAQEITRKALGEAHPEYARSLNNLAALYQAMGNDMAAEPLYRQASDTWRSALGEAHPDYATSLNNLAGLYRSLGNYTAAEPLYRQASEIWRKGLGETHPEYATSLNNLAALYDAMGSYAAAEPLYRQASDIWRNALGEMHPYFAASLANLAEVYSATNRESQALSLMQESAAITDRMIGQVFSIGSERQRQAYIATLERGFHIFLSMVLRSFSTTPQALQIGLDLVLRRKALGAEALAVQRDVVVGGRYPDLLSKLQELTTWRRQITQKILAGPGPEGTQVHQQLLAAWTTEKERLEQDLANQIPEMNLERRLRAADRIVVARALPAGAALVEFVRINVFVATAVPAHGETEWQPAHYLAFLLPAGVLDQVRLVDLGEAKPIDEAIALFRATAGGGNRAMPGEMNDTQPQAERAMARDLDQIHSSGDLLRSTGTTLRKAVFDPLVAVLDSCTRLFLAPDGDLTQLPFEALPLDDGRFLIDAYQVSYLSTGRDVLRFGNPPARSHQPPLVLAAPDFDLDAVSHGTLPVPPAVTGLQSRDPDRGSLRFTPLGGAHQEGEQVGRLLGIPPCLGQDALEGPLKRLHSPRLLHLATHGFFLSDQSRNPNLEQYALPEISSRDELHGRLFGQRLENPLLRSGLVLAGANTWLQGKPLPPEAEDGLLTAEDVTGLDLLDTELVVLSACDTGRGDVHVGEGVFGLRRAFVLAGAHTLVMSLWKVPDQATRELMVDFYRRLLSGQPRAEALRSAQLALKACPGFEHPRFWAAFICQGDPGPISG